MYFTTAHGTFTYVCPFLLEWVVFSFSYVLRAFTTFKTKYFSSIKEFNEIHLFLGVNLVHTFLGFFIVKTFHDVDARPSTNLS